VFSSDTDLTPVSEKHLAAACSFALGNSRETYRQITRALVIAAPEGYIRVFMIHDEAVRQLLFEASRRGLYPEIVDRILTSWEEKAAPAESPRKAQETPAKQAAAQKIFSMPAAAEVLTKRELQMLHLLNGPLSTPQIAEILVISTNTVRIHIKCI